MFTLRIRFVFEFLLFDCVGSVQESFMKNDTGSWPIVASGVGCLVVIVALLYYGNRKSDSPNAAPKVASDPVSAPVPAPEKNALPSDWAMIGGVSRPKTDVVLDKPGSESPKPLIAPQGFQPGLPVDANPQVAGVYASLKDRSEPSRFSSFAAALPFDRAAFEANPKGYVDVVEPSRVFSPAEPADGVIAVQPVGSRFHRVKQGETVRLSVNAIANAPVTFTSFDLGYFRGSRLSSETVLADDSGVATAEFTAGGGTVDDIKVLAAGPLTSGQVQFTVQVILPDL